MAIKDAKNVIDNLLFDNRRYEVVKFMFNYLVDSNYESYKELKDDAEYQAQLKDKIKETIKDCLDLGAEHLTLGGGRFPKYNKKDWEDKHLDSLSYWVMVMTYYEYISTHLELLPYDSKVEDFIKEDPKYFAIKNFHTEKDIDFRMEEVENILNSASCKDIDTVLEKFFKDSERFKFERRDVYEVSTIENNNTRMFYKHTCMVTSSSTNSYFDEEREWVCEEHTSNLPEMVWEEVNFNLDKDIIEIKRKWYNFFGKKLYLELRSQMRAEIEAFADVSIDGPLFKDMMSFIDGTCHRSDRSYRNKVGARDFLVLFGLIQEEDYQF